MKAKNKMPRTTRPLELTVRAVVLGALITVVFTAANVYLGLKVGLTFASTIPAAVISMAVLSAFKNSSILENNIVQTVASAAGTLSVHHLRAARPRHRRLVDGISLLAVASPSARPAACWASLFTIPLRRAMVTNSPLPYPEGVAAAEVLEGWRRRARRAHRGRARRPARGRAGLGRVGGTGRVRGHANRGRRSSQILPRRGGPPRG